MTENKLLKDYDQKFYSNQIEGSSLSASIVVPEILNVFPEIRSVVDIGCGAGTWLNEFKRNGITSIMGYDGGNPPSEYLLINPEEYSKADFTKGYPNQQKVDLAITLEVAEHLPEGHAERFIRHICEISDLILFSAAAPGQGGTNHINERWPSYWADIFIKLGYQFYDVLRPIIWYDNRVEWWYRQNIFLVARTSRSDITEILDKLNSNKPACLDVVHPDMYMQVRSEVHRDKRIIASLGVDSELTEIIVNKDRDIEKCKKELEAILDSYSWRLMSAPRAILKYAQLISRRFSFLRR